MAFSFGPLVAQLGFLGVALLVCIVALVLVRGRRKPSPADTLPSYDDTEDRIDALTRQVRRRSRIKSALARLTGAE